jgi:hypothetical protein
MSNPSQSTLSWPRSFLIAIVSALLTCVALVTISAVYTPNFLTDLVAGKRTRDLDGRLSKIEARLNALLPGSSSTVANQSTEIRLKQAETRLDTLEHSTKSVVSSEEQRSTLEEVRKELSDAHDQMARTEHETNTFFVLYALITGILVGDGILSKSRLEKQVNDASKKLDDAEEAIKKQHQILENRLTQQVNDAVLQVANAEQAARSNRDTFEAKMNQANSEAVSKAVDATSKAEIATEELEKKSKQLDQRSIEFENFIATRRKALFEAVPKFIDERLTDNITLDRAFRNPCELATIDEVDHLTFFSASFRFRAPESSEERYKYLKALIATSRHQIINSLPGAALNRLALFFEFDDRSDNSPEANRLRARAYSLCVRANYLLFGLRSQYKSVLPDPQLKDDLRRYRTEIETNVEKGKQADYYWALTHEYHAIYLSTLPIREDIPENEREKASLQNQKDAIEIYDQLLKNDSKFSPSTSRTSRRNICCCYKRVGDITGDYQPQFERLRSIPRESEIHRNLKVKPPGHADEYCQFLWHAIISDETFFSTVAHPEQINSYQKEWAAILRDKMDVSGMMNAYSELRSKIPSIDEWAVRPWTI